MDCKNMFESNRLAWNQALEYHQKAREGALYTGFENPHFTTFSRDCDHVLLAKLNKMELSGKTIAQIPCNNGRELLSLMRLGAEEAIGFDISDIAILEAKKFAEIANLNVKFVRTNILEIAEGYNNYFDFIFISEGSLQWFPDLNKYFSVIRRLLKRGGNILIFEIHPFAYCLENGFDCEKQNFSDIISYFEKGPYSYKGGLDYVGGVQYEAERCYWFMHQMSDIIGAMLHHDIAILEFDEYNLEMANNPKAKMLDKFPLSYLIRGKAN